MKPSVLRLKAGKAERVEVELDYGTSQIAMRVTDDGQKQMITGASDINNTMAANIRNADHVLKAAADNATGNMKYDTDNKTSLKNTSEPR